jgi:hypothetical protein
MPNVAPMTSSCALWRLRMSLDEATGAAKINIGAPQLSEILIAAHPRVQLRP